ncbi:MAG: hypothetical protein ACM3ZB_07015 [bacterium]
MQVKRYTRWEEEFDRELERRWRARQRRSSRRSSIAWVAAGLVYVALLIFCITR